MKDCVTFLSEPFEIKTGFAAEFDDPFGNGKHILSFIEGIVPRENPPWLWRKDLLIDVAVKLRHWHDATEVIKKLEKRLISLSEWSEAYGLETKNLDVIKDSGMYT